MDSLDLLKDTMMLKPIWPPKCMACQALVMYSKLTGKGQYLFNLYFDLLIYQEMHQIYNKLFRFTYLTLTPATHPPNQPPS